MFQELQAASRVLRVCLSPACSLLGLMVPLQDKARVRCDRYVFIDERTNESKSRQTVNDNRVTKRGGGGEEGGQTNQPFATHDIIIINHV